MYLSTLFVPWGEDGAVIALAAISLPAVRAGGV